MPTSIDTKKAADALVRLALALALAAALGALWQHGRSGLRLEVEAAHPAGATWRAQTTAHGLDADAVRRLTPPAAASVHARWSGVMRVDPAGTWTLRLRGDGRARLRIDGRPLLETGAAGHEARVGLPAGWVPIEIEWDVPAGVKQLRLRRAIDAGPFADLDPSTLFQQPQGGAALALHGLLAVVSALLPWTSLAAAIVLALGVIAGARGAAWGIAPAAFGAWFRGWRGRAALALLATLVVAWGVALRGEALIHSFWETHEWRWSEPLRPLLVSLKPDTMRWPAQVPYVGGDPYAYLYYGRHLRDFYEERVREPLFVYATHLGLLATDDNSVGVGLASAFFSALTVLGVFLVGRQAFSPGVGLLAALGFALDREVIALSIEGWRDDAFACGLIFFAWGALRFHARGRFSDALILGLAGGAAWLTRITSLTFLVPGLLLLAFVPRRAAQAGRGQRLGIAVLLCVAL
ncbi:MAG: glycosyltransferase family 39 protein, partial [Vicinamibacteria bacterium]|nr:glycosyltransferase family 39 protein [Vicinamibacteria bacterium]